jgi:hypothetical protein
VNLSTVEIPRTGARERAAEYSRQAKRIQDPQVRGEFEQIARAYRAAARDDIALISLSSTIAAGGTMPRTHVIASGTQHERRCEYLLPKLATCRSSARFVYSLGIERDGCVRFIDQLRPWHNYRSGRIEIDSGSFELPDGYTAGSEIGAYTQEAWAALVPIVPPKHLDRVNMNLDNYLTLWEVDEWTWRRDPAPPRDPALLQHLAGDLYAVLATWDLTELERIVLSGRRLDR